jgi:hypothetical protein
MLPLAQSLVSNKKDGKVVQRTFDEKTDNSWTFATALAEKLKPSCGPTKDGSAGRMRRHLGRRSLHDFPDGDVNGTYANACTWKPKTAANMT